MLEVDILCLVILMLVNVSACSAEGDHRASCRLKVVVKKDTILIRSQLNNHEDIIQEYVRTGNDNYTPNATYIGKKNAEVKELLRNKIHVTRDGTSPIFNSHTAPWHLFMQHGYCIPKLEAKDHQLTKDDIGSRWKDEKNREYVLGRIAGDYLYMLPKIRATATEGIYTRDWEHPYSGYPSVLHHLYGGKNNSDIKIKQGSTFQIRPIQKALERQFYVDGKQVKKYGVYECDEFQIIEVLSCLNPFSVETWFPKPVMKDEMLRIIQTFTFCGLSTLYKTVLDVKYPIMFESYGCNQAKHLMKYRNYDAYVMLPRVKKMQNGHRVDKPFVQNTKKGDNIIVRRNAEDLYDVDKLPDREISFLYHPLLGYKLGFASGLSLTKGINADVTRIDYIPMESQAICMSPSNRSKMYIKAINKEAFENGLLPRGFKAEFCSYFTYFDPSQNEGQVFWYKDGDEFYIYAHCQTKHDNMLVFVPTMMNDYMLTVLDKTEGTELKSEKIENGGFRLNYITNDANYIVLKAGK